MSVRAFAGWERRQGLRFRELGWLSAAVIGTLACKGEPPEAAASQLTPSISAERGSSQRAAAAPLRRPELGVIMIDGSSTVFPITEAVAEEFRGSSRARVTIGVSGTGGGFKKFCSGETAISGASRPVKPSEAAACQAGGVEYLELPIAYDGIAVVVNPENDWASELTLAELRALWRPEAQARIQRWSQLRSGWPDAEIHLFGPGVDSGTYDYFTLAVVGTEHASRGDFTSSEDDNMLAQGVSRDRLALGFFGYAYYAENRERLKLLAIDDQRTDNGTGPVKVSPETVRDGSYGPLSRPIFLYVSKAAALRPEVEAFVRFYLEQARRLATEVGYIALPESVSQLVSRRFESRLVGSVFGGSGSRVDVTMESLLGAE
jgi:phosphate transport system substrate-binding protein